MRVSLGTVEIDNLQRAAIAHHYGDVGLASRERCRSFVVRNGLGAVDDAVTVYQEYCDSLD